MLQSRVGSMQRSNEDCLPMKGHTRGEDAPTVLPIERTHRGGTHQQCNPTNGHTYFHPQCYPTNGHTHKLTGTDRQADRQADGQAGGQDHILSQADALTKNWWKITSRYAFTSKITEYSRGNHEDMMVTISNWVGNHDHVMITNLW